MGAAKTSTAVEASTEATTAAVKTSTTTATMAAMLGESRHGQTDESE